MDIVKVKFSLDVFDEYKVDFASYQEHFKYVDSDKYFRRHFNKHICYVIPGKETQIKSMAGQRQD